MPNQILYGFHNLETVYDDQVTEVGVEVVSKAISEAMAEHNRQLDAMLALFVTRTTDFKTVYRTATRNRLQPLDQDGRARPIQAGARYELGLPMQEAGTAWGQNWKASEKMTVRQANDTLALIMGADTQWVRDQLLAAIYDSVGYTFPDPEHGSLGVVGLANGDTVTYGIQTGALAAATDTHYLAQAAAISDLADPFPTIYTELAEHPENSGDVIALIPTGLKAAVEGLTGFVPLPDANVRESITARILVGTPNVTIPGKFFGYHDSGVYLAEWQSSIANYITAVITGGERPIAMREDVTPSLRGFRQVATREDHPFWEAQYYRQAGFGGWNRVGALVYMIGGAGYTQPTGYVAPIA